MSVNPKPIRECTRLGCATLPTGTRAQHCTECHEVFAGPYPGDLHRVGEFPDGRRCLTVDEMTERGMRVDRRGYWIGPSRGRQFPTSQRAEKSPNGGGVG